MATDLSGVITDVNDKMATLTEYSREELIGTPFKTYFTSPPLAEEGIRQVLREGSISNYELTACSRSGRETFVSCDASTLQDAQGKLQGVCAAVRDITHQKKLERQLRASDEYHRGLIEASADGLITVSLSGVIMDVNKQMCRLSGYARETLIGSPFASYFVDTFRAAEGVRLTLDQGGLSNYELTLRTQGGRQRLVSFNAAIFKDKAGTAQGIFASARDTTDQSLLQSQMAEERAYNRGLIEASVDGLITVDQGMAITDVNETMCRMAGRRRHRIIGSLFPYYFVERELAVEGVRQTFQEGAVTDYVLTLRGEDGSTVPVSFNAAVFRDTGGRVRGIFASARDVTERKRFEQALQEKNLELEKANLSKDRFLAAMSHELRTPLNAILGFTGTLLMRLPGPLTHDQETQLRTVQGSARHLLSLINDLLDLSRIESGKAQVNFEPVDCTSLIREVAMALEPLARVKGLQFELQLPEQDIVVETDRRALSQILINLTSNAIKFTETGIVRVGVTQDNSNGSGLTQIDVADTGIGIRAEDQAKLFQAFTRLNADKVTHEGTGLGLHLSEKLAHLLGGRVSFESEYGKGSRFSLILGPRRE
jgi:PAS domain S-box-containing protein